MKKLFIILFTLCLTLPMVAQDLPRHIFSGEWKAGHVQGIAVDKAQKYIYLSFTTQLIKMDLQGNVVGTVTGLLGHLGCIEYNEEDGRIYGSLEYKDDVIGKGILKREKHEGTLKNGFYIAIFDVEKIDRMNMSAEEDGIMTAVFLPIILNDYESRVILNGKDFPHRYCCSGIDGVSFGPKFGKTGGKNYLTVAYGIYSDVKRTDNDYQVLLQYDTKNWSKYEFPLSQERMHQSGPIKYDARYFVYTKNTDWGVQNLEYDKQTNLWFMAAYKGKKKGYENFTMFAIDGSIAPIKGYLKGVPYDTKKEKILTLAKRGKLDAKTGVYGWHFKYGTTGLCSLGDSLFYISHNGKNEKGQFSNIYLYQFVGGSEGFVKVK